MSATGVYNSFKRTTKDARLNEEVNVLSETGKIRRKDQSAKPRSLYNVSNRSRKILSTTQIMQTMIILWHEFARYLSLSSEFRRLHETQSKVRIQQTQIDSVRSMTVKMSLDCYDPLSDLLSNLF